MLTRAFFVFIALFFFWQVQASEAASISTSIDRASISMDETVVLSIRVSPQANSTPSFAELESQFDILKRGQNSQYRNINGQIEAFTEWQLTLAPKSTGKLVIPSIQYDQEYSDAIILYVSAADQSLTSLAPDIFLEIEAENTQPYVQQQVIVTIKLHTAVPLRVDEAPALNIPNVLLLPLKDSQYQKRVGDKVYSVSELRYALFPQISGELEIPIQTFTVTTRANSSFNNPQSYNQTETKRVRSRPITLAVQPQAKNYEGEHWLPASKLELKEQWSTELKDWTVGEPVTRKITIKAVGLSANQIPSLSLLDNQHFKQYREKPESTDAQDARGLSTTITESIAIVPTQPGVADLPEVKLYWWDTSTNSQKVALLPAREITINPNPNLTPALPIITPAPMVNELDLSYPLNNLPPNANAPDTSIVWKIISALLLLTNLILGALLFRGKRRGYSRAQNINPISSSQALTMTDIDAFFSQPMNKENTAQFLQTLNLHLPSKAINALADEALALKLKEEIQALSAYTYGTAQYYAGDIDSLRTLIHQALDNKGKPKPQPKPLLSNLYPD